MDKTKLKKVYLDNCAWCHLHEREEPEIPKILKEIFDVIYSEVNLCEIEKITDKRLLCGRAEIVEDSLRHIRLLKNVRVELTKNIKIDKTARGKNDGT